VLKARFRILFNRHQAVYIGRCDELKISVEEVQDGLYEARRLDIGDAPDEDTGFGLLCRGGP
jgi:hypothetical protein